jgi:hypothetical protein
MVCSLKICALLNNLASLNGFKFFRLRLYLQHHRVRQNHPLTHLKLVETLIPAKTFGNFRIYAKAPQAAMLVTQSSREK